MYNYLSGKIQERGEGFIVVECGGIGYELSVSTFCQDAFTNSNEICKIPVHLYVKEDEMRLFGFKNNAEKNLFRKLIAISGIGPKVAIAVLSGIPLDELTFSILNGDTKNLNKIKGIGKKTAERIVLELKDKFCEECGQIDFAFTSDVIISKASTIQEEAVMALISLGMTKNEAVAAVGKINPDGLNLEGIVLKALRGR